MEELLAALLGFAAGVVGGLLGVGGGILFVPALALLLDESQIRAEATSLLAIIPVAAVGTWRQLSYGNVRLAEGLVIGALSVVGVAIGVMIANSLSQRALELAFAALVVLIALRLFHRALASGSSEADPQRPR